jgi:hypothetical protein
MRLGDAQRPSPLQAHRHAQGSVDGWSVQVIPTSHWPAYGRMAADSNGSTAVLAGKWLTVLCRGMQQGKVVAPLASSNVFFVWYRGSMCRAGAAVQGSSSAEGSHTQVQASSVPS